MPLVNAPWFKDWSEGIRYNPGTRSINVENPSVVTEILAKYPFEALVPEQYRPFWKAAMDYRSAEEADLIRNPAPQQVTPQGAVVHSRRDVYGDPLGRTRSPLRIPLAGEDT